MRAHEGSARKDGEAHELGEGKGEDDEEGERRSGKERLAIEARRATQPEVCPVDGDRGRRVRLNIARRHRRDGRAWACPRARTHGRSRREAHQCTHQNHTDCPPSPTPSGPAPLSPILPPAALGGYVPLAIARVAARMPGSTPLLLSTSVVHTHQDA